MEYFLKIALFAFTSAGAMAAFRWLVGMPENFWWDVLIACTAYWFYDAIQFVRKK